MVFSSKERFFYHSYSWSWLKYSFEDNCTILTYGWLLVPSFNVSLSFSSNLIYIAYLISFILFWAFTILFPNKVLWFAFELFHFCFPKISASLKNLLVEKVCPGFFMFGPVQLGTMGSPGGPPHTLQSGWRSILNSSSTKQFSVALHTTRSFSDPTVSAIFGTQFQ